MGSNLLKWCVYALVLLAPGSLLIVPLVWLYRRLAASAGREIHG